MTRLVDRALIPRARLTHATLALVTLAAAGLVAWGLRGYWWGSMGALGAVWPVNGLIAGSVSAGLSAWIVGSHRASRMDAWAGGLGRHPRERSTAVAMWVARTQLIWSAATMVALVVATWMSRGLWIGDAWLLPAALAHLFAWSGLCGLFGVLLARRLPRFVAVIVGAVAPYGLAVALMQLDFVFSERFPLADLVPQELPTAPWSIHPLGALSAVAAALLLGGAVHASLSGRSALPWLTPATIAGVAMVATGGTSGVAPSSTELACSGDRPAVCVADHLAPALPEFEKVITDTYADIPPALHPDEVLPAWPENPAEPHRIAVMPPQGAGRVGSLWVDRDETIQQLGHAVFAGACSPLHPNSPAQTTTRPDPRTAETVGESWWLMRHGYPPVRAIDPANHEPDRADKAREALKIVDALLAADAEDVDRYWAEHAEAVTTCSPKPLPMP